jgi:tRNA:m4X modification enzyme
VIGVAKHLCGGATDLALTSMLTAKSKVKGLSMATCCHHRCDTTTYVNLPFISELGIAPNQFNQFVVKANHAVSTGDDVEKRTTGLMVKRMLDLGRVLFVRESLKLDVDAIQYCNCATESPESTLIIANQSGA